MSFDSNNWVSNEAREKERMDRLDRKNPPSTAHGQDDGGFDNLDIDSLFDNASSGNGGGFGSDNQFGSFGSNDSGQFGGFNSGFNTGFPDPSQQSNKREAEDILFDVVKKGGTGFLGFSKEFVNSFKGLDAIFWSRYGAMLFKISGVLSLLLFVLVILGVNTLDYVIGSGVATVIGVLALSFNNEKARQLKAMGSSTSETDFFDINKVGNDTPISDTFGDFNSDTNETQDSDIFDFDDFDEDEEDDDEFEFEDDEFYDDEGVTEFETVIEQESDVNAVLQQVDSIPQGMHTRQFLFENYTNVLTKMTPEFNNVIVLTEDDDEWDNYSSLVREAQEQMGLDSNDEYEDDLSELLGVEKRLLTIKIEATRPRKLTNAKVGDFDKELTSLVSVENGEIVEGRYTKTIVAGSKIYTTIFLGETATVSVKDALLKERDFFLDSSNRVPVVMGFDHLGNTIKVDLFDVESIITAGMPRGGKSFSVKTVMSQVIQFCSPKDVVFYFADVKGQLSDWYEFQMPHVKRFESKPERILAMLNYITEVEGEKRANIFRESGALNYKMYKKMNPDADMPIIYVVIDEMTTLSQEFNTDDFKQYKSKLINIVTRMPSFGVRLWGIPHVIKNDILPKTVSDTIGCRISVRGDESHIETTTGAKAKQFPYKLSNAGDCAVKLPAVKTEVFFMHSFIIAKSDEGVSRVLSYQTNLWNKLDPESAKSSFASQQAKLEKQNDLLTKINIDSEIKFDDDGMF